MKTEHKIIAFSIALGLLFWVIDAILDYFLFYEGSLWELFIADVPPHEIYIRSVAIILFFAFGLIIARFVTKRKQAGERIEHLNLVLKAIRSVNQLIVRETGRETLLKGSCDSLIKTRGYYNTWIVLLDESGKLVVHDEAGLVKDFLPMVERLKRGELTECGRQALKQAEAIAIEDPSSTCSDCPLATKYSGRGAMTIRLEHRGKVYGLLSASIPEEFIGDKEEQLLFKELAEDIGIALHGIELEEQRKRTEEELKKSEQRFRTIFDNATDGILLADIETNKLYTGNKTICQMLGYSLEEIKNLGVMDIHPKEDLPYVIEQFEKQVRGEFSLVKDILVKRKDGSVFYVEINSSSLTLAGKTYLTGIFRDITERKQAEEALRQSEERYRSLTDDVLDSSAVGIFILDSEFRVVWVNQSLEHYFGLRKDEVIGKDKRQLIREHIKDIFDDPEGFTKKVFATYDNNTYIENFECHVLSDSEREERWLEHWSQPIRIGLYAGGRIEHYYDITKRKQAEAELKESEEFNLSVLHNSPNPVLVAKPDTSIVYVNPALEELTGYSLDELIGQKIPRPWWSEEMYEKLEHDANLAYTRGYKRFEQLFKNKNGECFWVQINAIPVIINGEFRHFIANWVDITERKQTEEKIKHAAEEWRTTFDSITDSVFICDNDYKLVRVNKTFASASKMKPEELIGKRCYEIVHGTNEPIPNCPHQQTINTKKPAMVEFFEPHLGMYLEVALSPVFNEKGEVVACVHVIRDITERKKMEEQLIVTDRLASIGELSSGIAHELNNPLTGVIGFSDLLLDRDLPDDVKEDLKIIHSEAHRAAQVVKGLLTFARKHTPVKQLVNINSIIEKVLELRAYEQKVSNIQVNTRFAPDLPEITADYFQLQQVCLNIIINAEHFMIEANNRGTLTITTERIGGIIRASFADDGPGISKENVGHLFDPFFTTKEVGKGTGLGLSISYGIITEHGGRIYAESELGKGATFIIELPVTDH